MGPIIKVSFDHQAFHVDSQLTIPLHDFLEVCEPVKKHDEFRELDFQGERQRERILALRKAMAQRLSAELTDFLLNQVFNQLDKVNGYPVK